MSSAPAPQSDAHASALKVLRIVHVAMLASVLLYILIGEIVAAQVSSTTWATVPGAMDTLQIVLGVVAASLAIAALIVRQKVVSAAEHELVLNPLDDAALKLRRAGHIVTFAFAESIALLGLVLRLLGSEFSTALVFYSAAALLLVVFVPRRS